MIKINKWPIYEEDEISAAANILRSGAVNYWTGNETNMFEEEFSNFCGTKYAIALANGTLALSACYAALKMDKNAEIITTPRTFIATSSAARLMGLKVVFADVELDKECLYVLYKFIKGQNKVSKIRISLLLKILPIGVFTDLLSNPEIL